VRACVCVCVCVCVSASGRYCLTQMTRHICFAIVSVRKKNQENKTLILWIHIEERGMLLGEK